MEPSQVRKRILREHRVLRDQLLRLESELDALAKNPQNKQAVIEAARELMVELTAHTEVEDAILAPALRDIDAWGPVRADMLLDHHREQRQQLRELLAAYAHNPNLRQVARMTMQLIVDVRADMLHEENTLLANSLLRDDLVAIDMEAG